MDEEDASMPEGAPLVDVPWDDVLDLVKQRNTLLWVVVGILGVRFALVPAIAAWRRRT